MKKERGHNSGERPVPENLQPFVEALGVEKACELFLKLGGSEVYLAENPQAGSIAVEAIGTDGVRQLAKALGHGHIRVPLAKAWTVQTLLDDGKSIAHIARTVRVSDRTILRWLADGSKDRQLSLFS